MNLILNKMTLQDLENIKDILKSDFDNFWNYNIFKNELNNPNSIYIIAKLNSEIVGLGGLWQSVDDIHITNIVTKIDKRNYGIGSKILENLIDISQKLSYNSITLEVNEHNINAIKLYKKYNFQELGIRKKYYNNTDNAIIMTLKID